MLDGNPKNVPGRTEHPGVVPAGSCTTRCYFVRVLLAGGFGGSVFTGCWNAARVVGSSAERLEREAAKRDEAAEMQLDTFQAWR